MNKNNNLFTFLQSVVDNSVKCNAQLSADGWNELYSLAHEQALSGVIFSAVEMLDSSQRPHSDLNFRWIGRTNKIERRNEELTDLCWRVCRGFTDDGFDCCILKGQGNLLYYPDHLAKRRTSGDIDIWVWPKDKLKHDLKNPKKSVIEYCFAKMPTNKIDNVLNNMRQHHIDFPVLKNTGIEVHFIPLYFYNPFTQKKWINYCENAKRSHIIETNRKFNIPDTSFNVVYQLAHIYQHLFCEGIGLKQLLDYYFVLKQYNNSGIEEIKLIKALGMDRFAGAIMWVMQYVFAMPSNYCICEPNEKAGKFVLNEIMQAGNMGRFDDRYKELKDSNKLKRFFLLTKRNFNFLNQYPSEVLWIPIIRIWNVIWRKFKLWKY